MTQQKSDMVQKKCYIVKTSWGYGWFQPTPETHPADICIMAVHSKKKTTNADLYDFRNNGTITSEDVCAIQAFDASCGTKQDYKLIQKLAEKFHIELVIKESDELG